MTSDCLGENRITSAPKRAISYRAHAAAIISIAQHARPIGIGQSEFFRIQLMHASRREKIMFPSTLESYATGATVAIGKRLWFAGAEAREFWQRVQRG